MSKNGRHLPGFVNQLKDIERKLDPSNYPQRASSSNRLQKDSIKSMKDYWNMSEFMSAFDRIRKISYRLGPSFQLLLRQLDQIEREYSHSYREKTIIQLRLMVVTAIQQLKRQRDSMTEVMTHVFISYVRENEAAVKRLAETLRARGIDVWLDRDSITPGRRWKREIRKAITEGGFFIACFSAEYSVRDKTYMNEELTIAIEELRQRPTDRAWFVPVMLSECRVPDRDIGAGETLHDIQWLELWRDWDRGLEKLVAILMPQASDSRHLTLGAEHWTPILMYHDHTGKNLVRVFEVDVHNRHDEKGAANAIARLIQITDPDGTIRSDVDRSPLKVVGETAYSQTILPLDHQAWDLLAVRMEAPSTICLNSALDVTPRTPVISSPGAHVLRYEVRAEHFPVLDFDVKLDVSEDPRATRAMLGEARIRTLKGSAQADATLVNRTLRGQRDGAPASLLDTDALSTLSEALDKARDLGLYVLSAPFHRPFQYVGMPIPQAAATVGGTPNRVGNITVESDTARLFLEAEGNFVNYVEVDLKETAPCSLNREFDSEPILGILSISPSELELAHKQTHSHTYYDHKRRLKVGVSCDYDGGPLSVGFSSKYYGM